MSRVELLITVFGVATTVGTAVGQFVFLTFRKEIESLRRKMGRVEEGVQELRKSVTPDPMRSFRTSASEEITKVGRPPR